MAMDPTQASYVWLAVFFIGLVVFFMGIFRKYSPIKMNPVLGAVVGICLILPGFIWGIMPNFPDQPLQQAPGQTIVVQNPGGITTTVPPASFSIDATACQSAASVIFGGEPLDGVLNVAETVYTLPATQRANDTGFTVNFTALNFTVTPVAPSGATADDLATIYFETQYATEWENEPMLEQDSNDVYFANWTRVTPVTANSVTYGYSGSASMLYTETQNYQVVYKYDYHLASTTTGPALMHTVGDTLSWTATFHNVDWSWSQSYTFMLICIA